MMKYIQLLKDVYDSSTTEINSLFSHIIGYIIMLAMFILSTFGDKVQLFNYIFLCMIIDLIWGIISNISKGTFGLSKCFVRSAIKLLIYCSLFAMAVLIEKVMYNDMSILTRAISTVLCSAELLSIMAHILIVKPNMPVLKLLSKYFTKEIAKKLSLHEIDVNELINKDKL